VIDDRESIALWLERMADAHEKKRKSDPKFEKFHDLTATIYRARASDIRAGLDVAG
jgi:hypothetical protein